MFCSNCGTSLPPDSQFCPSCGRSINAGAAAGGPAAPPPMGAAPTFQPSFTPQPAVAPVQQPTPGFGARLRAMKTWKKVALGIVVFVVGVIALAMFATSGLDKPVERHFAALRAGDTVAAYSELSVAARQTTSMDAFKAMLTGTPALTHVTGQSFDSRTYSNGQGQLVGMLEIEGGGKLPITVNLVKENDQWKILSYHVTPVKTE